jgi:D-xylose transport system ATP-binding protein
VRDFVQGKMEIVLVQRLPDGRRSGAVLPVPGEVTAIIGDNGAGKSTLIRCVSGVEHPDRGEILINGAEVTLESPDDCRRHGVETAYQDLALIEAVVRWAGGHKS